MTIPRQKEYEITMKLRRLLEWIGKDDRHRRCFPPLSLIQRRMVVRSEDAIPVCQVASHVAPPGFCIRISILFISSKDMPLPLPLFTTFWLQFGLLPLPTQLPITHYPLPITHYPPFQDFQYLPSSFTTLSLSSLLIYLSTSL